MKRLAWIKLSIIISLLGNEISAATFSLPADDPKTLAAYYQTLDGIADVSLEAQISELQDFVKRFPEFDRSYQRLLERYILNEQIPEAKKFFTVSVAGKSAYRTCQWMLAKIYLLENDAEAALQAFSAALRAAQPPPQLLIDFLSFDKKHFRKFNDATYLQKIAPGEETRKVANALFSYVNVEFQKAIEQFNQLPETASNELTILYSWGYSHFILAQYEKANSIWQRGLTISRKTHDLEFEAKFLLALGWLFKTSHTSRALSYYDSSYTIASRIGDLKNMEYIAGNRAIIYTERGEYALAEKLLLEVIDLNVKLKSNWNLAVWYARYGNLLLNVQRFDEAIKAYDRCEKFAKKSNHERMLIYSIIYKGELYGFTGQHELARAFFQRAYELAQKRQLPESERLARIRLADVYIKEGEHNRARAIYQEYLTSPTYRQGHEVNRSHWLFKIGQSYLFEKDFEPARPYLQQAFEVAKQAGFDLRMMESLIYLGEIDLVENKFEQAEQKLSSCLEIAIAKKDSSTLPAVYLGLGNVYKKIGQLTKAIASYRKAAHFIENTRNRLKSEQFRIEFFVDASEIYQNLIDCYYRFYQKNKNPVYLDSLYTYLEMSRGRALKDLKQQKISNANDAIEDEQHSAYRLVADKLKRKQRQLRDKARTLSPDNDLDEILSEIKIAQLSLIAQRLRLMDKDRASSRSYNSAVHLLSTVVKNSKKLDLGILLYHISADVSFVLAVAGDDVRVVPLQLTVSALNASINSLIAPFHQIDEISVKETPFKAEIAHRLYNMLIKPVEDSLTLYKNLLIVPDIALMNLPFEMLLTRAPDKSEYTPEDKPTYAEYFLQHRYAVVYSPTTTLLEPASKWFFSKPDVLVFANPFADTPLLTDKEITGVSSSYIAQNRTLRQLHFRTGWRLEPLPFSEVEAHKIREISASTKVYKKSNATKENFTREAPKADLIHLATHGFIDSTYDAFSGLVFAMGDGATDDGLLMGYEIADLKLDCDLITLSACETGRGRLVEGEGVLGMPRLFLSAGAKSVLMTLWKVDDIFSSQLMPEVYNQYLNHNLSKANALAIAKRTLLNRKKITEIGVYYQHPVFWASFTLFGDPGMKRYAATPVLIIFMLVAALVVTLVTFSYRRTKPK